MRELTPEQRADQAMDLAWGGYVIPPDMYQYLKHAIVVHIEAAVREAEAKHATEKQQPRSK